MLTLANRFSTKYETPVKENLALVLFLKINKNNKEKKVS